MSLVDKLEGAHVGDLILLKGKTKDSGRVGFVFNYSSTEIKLSNAPTRLDDGSIRDDGFWNRYDAEKLATIPLCWWDSYEILKKYE